MRKLIVNADDFGVAEGVNRGIIQGFRHGVITSTSLLANGAAFESAVALAKKHAELGVGVHLNLTEGKPIAGSSQVPTLVNSQGLFFRGAARQAERILTRRASLREIERELRSQIQKVRAAGVLVTHLDGHQHVHLVPQVFDIVLKLAQEFGITAVRCTMERWVETLRLIRRNGMSSTAVLKQFLTGRALTVLSSSLKEKLRRAGVKCPDHFYGVSQTGFLDLAAVEKIIRQLPEGVSELMCHPGYVDAGLTQTPTRLLLQREKELQALTKPAVRRLIAAQAVELINYRNLVESK